MRHARSDFNEITIRNLGGQNNTKAPFLKDSKLSFKGIGDCCELAKIFKDMKIRLVLVSPLRRCLETALYLFRTTEISQRPQIIVNPNLMEKATRMTELPTFYAKAMDATEYSHFDFSAMRQAMRSPFWDVPVYEEHKELLEQLLSFTTRDNVSSHLLKFSFFRKGDLGTDRLVDTHLNERIETFEEELKLVIVNHQLQESLADHQVLLISHFNWMIQYLQLRGHRLSQFDPALSNLKTFSIEMQLD